MIAVMIDPRLMAGEAAGFGAACKYGGGNGPQMCLHAAVCGAGGLCRLYAGKARRAANWWPCAANFALGWQWCSAACGLDK